MAEHNTDVALGKRIEFRIGIHVGDVIIAELNILVKASILQRVSKGSLNRAALADPTMRTGKVVAR
jgi:hypothetical protein